MKSSLREKWNDCALWRLLWPLIAEQVLSVTIGVVDTVMVMSVGESAVSGVSIVDAVNMLLIIAFSALATGGSVVVSQFIGRRDEIRARLSAKQLMYVSAAVSLLIMIFTLVSRRSLLRLIYGRISVEVMSAAEIYFLLSALSYPSLALYNTAASLFRSIGNSRVPMLVALMVNMMNVGGNALFVFGFKLGVAGAGIATLASRTAAALVLLIMLVTDKKSSISLSGIFRVRLNVPTIKNILRVGIPSGLESSMFQIGKVLVSRIFTTFGTAAIAANAVSGAINSFTFMPGNGFGVAVLTIAGQCAGAKDFESAKYLTGKLMKLAYATVAGFSLIILLTRESIISLFGLSPEAALIAKNFLLIHCIMSPLSWPSSFTLPNALRATGDVRYCMVVSIASMWIVRVSFAYLFAYAFHMGPIGAWIAMVSDWCVRAVFFIIRWRNGIWQTKTVIQD
ncbi:MAG: MATE family efflux transporter [Treponema sp.]|nr:MATE family efflux transporter [Treponema sp.]